jgi:hypothetical protein
MPAKKELRKMLWLDPDGATSWRSLATATNPARSWSPAAPRGSLVRDHGQPDHCRRHPRPPGPQGPSQRPTVTAYERGGLQLSELTTT